MHKTRVIAMAVTLAALAALLSSCGTATGIAAVVAGDGFSCARLDDGRVACWGTNARGQTGTGTLTGSTTPVAVPGLSATVDVTAGATHACAVDGGGAVRCWGANDAGQVGDGTTTDAPVPVPVVGVTDVVAVAAGDAHTCALRSDGSVRCWGANDSGQLGAGMGVGATPKPTVASVPAVTDDGSVWTWAAALPAHNRSNAADPPAATPARRSRPRAWSARRGDRTDRPRPASERVSTERGRSTGTSIGSSVRRRWTGAHQGAHGRPPCKRKGSPVGRSG